MAARAVVDALLKAGADANSEVTDGETVLMLAARTGKPEAVRLLLDGAPTSTRAKPGMVRRP